MLPRRYVLGNRGGEINSLQVSLRSLGDAGLPLVVMHGDQDKYVKFAQGEMLASWGRPDKTEMVSIPNNCHPVPDALPFVEEYLQRML